MSDLAVNDWVGREDENGIATLTLKNPKALNALSEAMLHSLQTHFDDLAKDRQIRVVILRAEGKAFCAGHDLKEMTAARANEDNGRAYFERLFKACSDVMLALRALPQPVIAEAHGIATAAGCQLVATCDLAIAEEGTRFGVNGVNIGLFCSTPMVALSRNISRKKTFELLTTGDFLSTEEALSHGLINDIAKPGELQASTRALAEKIAGKLASAVKVGKEAFYNQLEMGVEDAYAYTSQVITENMLDRDTAEGVSAFIEKRPAGWKNP